MSFLIRVLFLAACLAVAQSPSANTVKVESIAPLVKKQFGPNFTVTATGASAVISADFDGDGVEDAVIVADSKDPLPDSYEFKYVVADPYNSFFGFGNPNQTAGFNTNDPKHNHDLLVIFGAGPEAWHADTPKAKFVLINVPFDTIEIGRLMLKKAKPPIFVIRAVEAEVMESNIYWEVKKKRWKWQPRGGVQ